MTDADRELVELAARAIDFKYDYLSDCATKDGIDFFEWNPLESDGDAFRLLVKISQRPGGAALMLNSRLNMCHVAQCHTDRHTISPSEYMTDNPAAATRRVITLAAAEIGRGLDDRSSALY